MWFTPSRPSRHTLALCLLLALSMPSRSELSVQSETASGSAPTEATTPLIEQERARIREFVERANVKEKLKALGVSGFWAQSRVDSLTEEEVHALAERIDGMPAGGALSQMDMVIVLLIAILVAILL